MSDFERVEGVVDLKEVLSILEKCSNNGFSCDNKCESCDFKAECTDFPLMVQLLFGKK